MHWKFYYTIKKIEINQLFNLARGTHQKKIEINQLFNLARGTHQKKIDL